MPKSPGYVLAQAAGAMLASATLLAEFGHNGKDGMKVPGPEFTDFQAFTVQVLLTAGLVGTVLAVASGAQNVGALSAFGIAAYIVMAGLWGGPVSGASMDPIRSFGPDLTTGDFSRSWIYATGPVAGSVLAAAIARVLRGRGGQAAADGAVVLAPVAGCVAGEMPKPVIGRVGKEMFPPASEVACCVWRRELLGMWRHHRLYRR